MRSSVYRARQFWMALFQKPSEAQRQRARAALSPREFSLFQQMQPSEQLHCIQVMDRLIDQGQDDPHLLAAALLHDVGKSKLPLNVWERAAIVLFKALLPKMAEQWGKQKPVDAGWRKAFIVAQHHPTWGAAMASQVGSSIDTVNLIQRHQEKQNHPLREHEDELLALLQAADGKN